MSHTLLNFLIISLIIIAQYFSTINGFVIGINSILDALDIEFLQELDLIGKQKRLKELLTVWLPYTMGFVDLTSPLEVWNYLILCMPFVILVLICQYLGIPYILKFLVHAAKVWLTTLAVQKDFIGEKSESVSFGQNEATNSYYPVYKPQ